MTITHHHFQCCIVYEKPYDSSNYLPRPNVQLAAVDDARELKQDGEPTTHPDPIASSNVHVITGVLSENLSVTRIKIITEILILTLMTDLRM